MSAPHIDTELKARDINFNFADSFNCCRGCFCCRPSEKDVVYVNHYGEIEKFDRKKASPDLYEHAQSANRIAQIARQKIQDMVEGLIFNEKVINYFRLTYDVNLLDRGELISFEVDRLEYITELNLREYDGVFRYSEVKKIANGVKEIIKELSRVANLS
jgi:hypothetical protein